MKRYDKLLKQCISTFISISIILVIWWLINLSSLVNPLFIPDLGKTWKSLATLLHDSSLYQSIGITFYRSFTGLFLSIFIGVPAGLILARIKWLFNYFEFPIEFFRAVPSSALFPLFILSFGIGNASKIGIAFYACSLILLVNSFYGALPTQEKLDRINMLRSFGANKYQILFYSVVRDAIPNISAGIRVCLSYSLALVVVTEMFLGANDGLGKMIYDYYLQYRIPEMYAVIIVLGIVGFFINQIYIILENKFIFWSPK
jgi:NitT/TauT family transport system permease protein